MQTRPRYESAIDRSNEERAIAAYCSRLPGVTYRKLTDEDRFDYALYAFGELRAVVEIKTRTCSSTTYPSAMINKDKYDAGVEYLRRGLVVVILYQWTDGLYRHLLSDEPDAGYQFREGGRKDRNDPFDIAPCVYIPVRDFLEVSRET